VNCKFILYLPTLGPVNVGVVYPESSAKTCLNIKSFQKYPLLNLSMSFNKHGRCHDRKLRHFLRHEVKALREC